MKLFRRNILEVSMQETFLFCLIFYICFGIIGSEDSDSQSENGTTGTNSSTTPKCWMTLQAPSFIDRMNELDMKYAKARQDVQIHFDKTNFDQYMLKAVLKDRGITHRRIHENKYSGASMPSGINLGGMCLVRMPFSVIFFHRMKLRYDTHFRIDVLHSDMENMVLRVDLSLNTLSLKGEYERVMTDMVPSSLIYTPALGELNIYLEDVSYAIEGRYRVIKNRLVIELIHSSLTCKSIKLQYENSTSANPNESMQLEKENIGDYLQRLKTDLDKWMKDYFNDYLIQANLENVPSINELEKYDQEKASLTAEFTDKALELINKRIQDVNGDLLHIPRFRLIASHGMTIQLKDGTLRGLETMYRRSVGTTVSRRQNLRYVDTIIGFSDMKISYTYQVNFPPDSQSPPLGGLVIMSANELTAHLSLGLLKNPEMVDLDIDFINHIGPDSITVEGGARMLISTFKHLLKLEIATLMYSTLTYSLRMLKTLPKCDPFLPGLVKPKIIKIDTEPISISEDSKSKDVPNAISSEGNDDKKKKPLVYFTPFWPLGNLKHKNPLETEKKILKKKKKINPK